MRTPLLLAAFIFCTAPLLAADTRDPKASLEKLMEGNRRYVKGQSINETDLETKREGLLSSQDPIAVIVGCSDSRVPPEIVFDQSLGDLFVVRVAGNVIGPIEMDSIEYSADHLLTPLIFVLGHQGCGAVKAFLDEPEDPDLVHIAPQLEEAVQESKDLPGDPWMNAIKANVRLSIDRLKENPVLQQRIQNKQLQIRGGYYDLKSGQVRLLSSN